jgi:hypothetical protein
MLSFDNFTRSFFAFLGLIIRSTKLKNIDLRTVFLLFLLKGFGGEKKIVSLPSIFDNQ